MAGAEIGPEIDVENGTPNTCNTGVQNRQSAIESLAINPSGGIDTLEISLYGFHHLSGWESLRERLNAARLKSQSASEFMGTIETAEGDILTVEPVGLRKGSYCQWVLRWKGCDIAIVDNPAPSESRLSIWVCIGSIRLMEVGHVEAWDSLMGVLASLGYCHEREIVGRVDLCSDFANETMQPVQEAVIDHRFVARSKRDRIHRRLGKEPIFETYTIGGKEISLRIYDKVREVRNDPVKQSILIQNRWGGSVESAIRVEFQIRGKALKRYFSIRSVADLFANLGTVTEWLTNDWFRIVDSVDRENGNQRRAGPSAWWSMVQERFRQWTGESLPRVEASRRSMPDMAQLGKQLVGVGVSIAAHTGQTLWQVLNQLAQDIRQVGNGKLEAKRIKLSAVGRCGVMIDESDIPF